MRTIEEQEYYDRMLQEGLEYQDFIKKELWVRGICYMECSSKKSQYTIGENSLGMEIKFDRRLVETGNLYIECFEKHKGNSNYVSSGIYRTDNSFFYLIGDKERSYLFPKAFLQYLYVNMSSDHTTNNRPFKRIKIETSSGFLLPIEWVERMGVGQNIFKKDIIVDNKPYSLVDKINEAKFNNK